MAEPRLLRIDDLELAFPNNQAKGTRLVLTQSTYLLQKWIDTIGSSDRIIATATGDPLRRSAAEAFERRGPWRRFEIVDLDETTPSTAVDLRDREDIGNAFPPGSSALEARLARAFHSGSGVERLRLCREAFVEAALSPVAALACASACREQQDLAAARKALDTARQLAPDWEAIHYEDGKFWLACEEMELACEAFQRATECMPSFSAAYSNLGATLGELDRPEGALAAFAHALESDPESFTLLNNVGVVNRELGRLAESEAALSRVIQIAPDFVFGYYNLGHTRLLRGDYRGALEAYEEGQRRDGEKNRRQGCRLAIVRFANGDVDGAQRDLWRMADAAPPEEREDLLLEAYEIAQAVVRARPELAARRAFIDRIAAEIEGPSK